MSYLITYLIAGLVCLLVFMAIGIFYYGYSIREATLSRAVLIILLWPILIGELVMEYVNDGESP